MCSQCKNYICINSLRLAYFHVYNLPQFGLATLQVLMATVLGWLVATGLDVVALDFQLPGLGLIL